MAKEVKILVLQDEGAKIQQKLNQWISTGYDVEIMGMQVVVYIQNQPIYHVIVKRVKEE